MYRQKYVTWTKGMEPENQRTATQRDSCNVLFEGSSAALDRSEKFLLQEDARPYTFYLELRIELVIELVWSGRSQQVWSLIFSWKTALWKPKPTKKNGKKKKHNTDPLPGKELIRDI